VYLPKDGNQRGALVRENISVGVTGLVFQLLNRWKSIIVSGKSSPTLA